MNECSLIETYFKSISKKDDQVLLGIGDDAACIKVPEKHNLLVSTDSLVANVHFLPEWDAYDIACRAVLVNVSDMAAMAADPRWLTLALTLPSLDKPWLKAFSKGLETTLKQFNIQLIGGDTTKGPLTINMTILGLVPAGLAVLRSGANAGDTIFVSGTLGGAALGLRLLNDPRLSLTDRSCLMKKLVHPKPRVDLAPFLRSYASACIDLSDGLSLDLNHICKASGLGASLNQEQIPMHPLLQIYCPEKALDLALTGGDDYELCFTVPPQHREALIQDLALNGLSCYPVGVIEESPGLRLKLADNTYTPLAPCGYSHF